MISFVNLACLLNHIALDFGFYAHIFWILVIYIYYLASLTQRFSDVVHFVISIKAPAFHFINSLDFEVGSIGNHYKLLKHCLGKYCR